jgi:hypothetical protein
VRGQVACDMFAPLGCCCMSILTEGSLASACSSYRLACHLAAAALLLLHCCCLCYFILQAGTAETLPGNEMAETADQDPAIQRRQRQAGEVQQ